MHSVYKKLHFKRNMLTAVWIKCHIPPLKSFQFNKVFSKLIHCWSGETGMLQILLIWWNWYATHFVMWNVSYITFSPIFTGSQTIHDECAKFHNSCQTSSSTDIILIFPLICSSISSQNKTVMSPFMKPPPYHPSSLSLSSSHHPKHNGIKTKTISFLLFFFPFIS